MNLRLRFSRTTGLCDPHESKHPNDIGMELQDGFFGHIVSTFPVTGARRTT
jgi:hypothetical protein